MIPASLMPLPIKFLGIHSIFPAPRIPLFSRTGRVVRRPDKEKDMKNITWQRTFSLAQLLLGLALAVFIAGIVVPSLLRSGIATREALAAGSLHALKVASVTFLFTYKNLVAAILGVLIGGSAALAIDVGSSRFWLSHALAIVKACVYSGCL